MEVSPEFKLDRLSDVILLFELVLLEAVVELSVELVVLLSEMLEGSESSLVFGIVIFSKVVLFSRFSDLFVSGVTLFSKFVELFDVCVALSLT